MAKTAKHDAIGKEKDDLILAIDRIRVVIQQKALTIPDSVRYGDAVISARWLERAEARFRHADEKIASKRKTADELRALLAEEQELLDTLTNPPLPSDAGFVPDQNQNDLFGAIA